VPASGLVLGMEQVPVLEQVLEQVSVLEQVQRSWL
jgi:hypothetical protein